MIKEIKISTQNENKIENNINIQQNNKQINNKKNKKTNKEIINSRKLYLYKEKTIKKTKEKNKILRNKKIVNRIYLRYINFLYIILYFIIIFIKISLSNKVLNKIRNLNLCFESEINLVINGIITDDNTINFYEKFHGPYQILINETIYNDSIFFNNIQNETIQLDGIIHCKIVLICLRIYIILQVLIYLN